MKQLKLSDDLSLPLDAATQTFAFIARKGAGKTYAAGKLTELLMDSGVQCVILDTVGNWYGLRLGADGKSKGFDVPVLGGLRGDIPLEAAGGELVADLVVESGRSVVIDISQFSQADRKRFATAFGVRLWQRKKSEPNPTPLHLVIEESQLIIPQFVGRDDARMVGIYEEIIRLGRNYGIGVSMITQRPQSVNKEVLTQTECLIVLQVNGTPERKALKEWIVQHGVDVNLLNELPSLPIGTAYVWSPQWLNVLEKVKIGEKRTFDASATPKVGSRIVRRELEPLDLDAFKAKMAATIERAKENDPAELKKEIATLKRKLSDVEKNKSVETKEINVPVFSEHDKATLHRAQKVVEDLQSELSHAMDGIQKVAVELNTLRATITAKLNIHSVARSQAPEAPAREPRHIHVKIHAPSTLRIPEGNGTLGKCERAILTALAQYPQGRCVNQVAILTGYSGNSGGFNNSLSKLRSSDYISRGQPIQITEAGVAALGDWQPLPTGEALQAHWLNRVGKCERGILEALLGAYPEGMASEQLAEMTGYSSNSGGFNNSLSRLRTLELITRGQPIRASEEFFQ